jgi:hypothetical protein
MRSPDEIEERCNRMVRKKGKVKRKTYTSIRLVIDGA